jgi:hypothetical protein
LGKGAALMVPSSIIPMENNAILNPRHPTFVSYLRRVKKLPLAFDSRLVKLVQSLLIEQTKKPPHAEAF